MTVIDRLLEPRRARTIATRALLNHGFPLIALPVLLLLPFPAAAVAALTLSFTLGRDGRPVEVWDALERPDKLERRRGIRSAAFLRFWAERAGWPIERTLRIRRILRAASVVVYLFLGAWLVHGLLATGP